MGLETKNKANPLKVLLDSDRRRRSFLYEKLNISKERFNFLLREPQHLNCGEAFSCCEFFKINPLWLFDGLQGQSSQLIEQRPNFSFHLFYSGNFKSEHLWQLIDILQERFGWSEEQIAHAARLTLGQYQYYSGRQRSFPFLAGMWLASVLKEDLVQIHDADFDFEAFEKRLRFKDETQAHLPQKFVIGAGSKMRLFENSLDYLSKCYGPDFADTVLRAMEMPESALKFKDKDISILTFKALHRKAIALAQDKMLPFELGRHNRFNQSNIAMVRQLVPPCSHAEFYRLMCEEISSKMDQNFFYRIAEVSENAVKILACTRAERLEALGGHFLDRNIALYIYGHFLVAPTYIELPEAQGSLLSLEVSPKAGTFSFRCSFF